MRRAGTFFVSPFFCFCSPLGPFIFLPYTLGFPGVLYGGLIYSAFYPSKNRKDCI